MICNHAWQSTLDPKVLRCLYCSALLINSNGAWTIVVPPPKKKKKKGESNAPDLFS